MLKINNDPAPLNYRKDHFNVIILQVFTREGLYLGVSPLSLRSSKVQLISEISAFMNESQQEKKNALT